MGRETQKPVPWKTDASADKTRFAGKPRSLANSRRGSRAPRGSHCPLLPPRWPWSAWRRTSSASTHGRVAWWRVGCRGAGGAVRACRVPGLARVRGGVPGVPQCRRWRCDPASQCAGRSRGRGQPGGAATGRPGRSWSRCSEVWGSRNLVPQRLGIPRLARWVQPLQKMRSLRQPPRCPMRPRSLVQARGLVRLAVVVVGGRDAAGWV